MMQQIKQKVLKDFLGSQADKFKFKYSKNMFEATLNDELKDEHSYVIALNKQARIGSSKNNSKCIVIDLITLSKQTEVDLSYWEDLFEDDDVEELTEFLTGLEE